MKIAFKILSGYLAISILLIAMGVLVIRTTSVLNPVIDELDKEVNSLSVALTIADLTSQIDLLRSNLRVMATQFYFTRQAAQVEKYERTARELERVFEQINQRTLQVVHEDDRKIFSNLQLSTNRLAKFERQFMLLAKDNQPASYQYLTRNSEYQQLNKSISNFITSYSFSRKVESTDVFSRLVTISDSIQSSKVELNLRSKITLLLIALVSIASLLVGAMVARSISSPLGALKRTTELLAGGDMSARSSIQNKDEIGSLARSFNIMVSQLQQSTVSMDYFSNIIQSMQDCLLVLTPSGHIQTVNRSAVDLLGFDKQELIGKSLTEVIEEEQKQFQQIGLAELIKKGSVQGLEVSYVAKGGHKVPMLFSGSVMKDSDGKMKGIVCVAQDLTKQRQAESALRERGERLHAIINCTVDGIITIDERGKIETFNLAAENLFGYSVSQVIGQNIKMLMPEEHLSKHDNYLKHYQETREKRIIGIGRELVGKRKDATTFPMALAVSEVRLENQRIYTGIVRDLTERNQADAEIRRAHEKLMTANKKLLETQSQLVQSAKLASVGEMATGVAHELNQPLAIISMNCHLHLKQVRKGKYDEIEAGYELILSQVRRAATIIKHLKTFGRESKTLSKSPNDVNRIVEDSLIMLSEQLRLLNIEVVKVLDNNLSLLNCNSIQIEQVLTNLLMNAKDALATVNPKKIIVRSLQRNGNIVVEVEDTGKGIPESNLEKIFDPFFTRKEVGKGTGLGLSISYGIIQDHGGHLSVSSKEGEGATFRIELPAAGK